MTTNEPTQAACPMPSPAALTDIGSRIQDVASALSGISPTLLKFTEGAPADICEMLFLVAGSSRRLARELWTLNDDLEKLT